MRCKESCPDSKLQPLGGWSFLNERKPFPRLECKAFRKHGSFQAFSQDYSEWLGFLIDGLVLYFHSRGV